MISDLHFKSFTLVRLVKSGWLGVKYYQSFTLANKRLRLFTGMTKLMHLIEDALFQITQKQREQQVIEFADRIQEWLQDDMADIISAQAKSVNIAEKLAKTFELVRCDIESRFNILQGICISSGIRVNTTFSHKSSVQNASHLGNSQQGDVLADIYAMESDLLKTEAFQKLGEEWDEYCSTVRSLVHDRVRFKKHLLNIKHARTKLKQIRQQLKDPQSPCSATEKQLLLEQLSSLAVTLETMKCIITEIDQQFDYSYPISRDIALFKKLSHQFYRTHQVPNSH